MGKKLAPVSLREQLIREIKESILTNRYLPGEILQIDRLAEEFGVSTTPVREALISLESEAVVQLIPNRGAMVTDIEEADVRHTWEMRRALEPLAARMTAQMQLAEEIGDLQKRIERILRGDYDFSLYIETDLALHELLFRNLPNPLLRDTLERFHNMSRRMRYFVEDFTEPHKEIVEKVTREHQAILKALKRHDSERAELEALRHLENSERRILSALERRSPTHAAGGTPRQDSLGRKRDTDEIDRQ